MITDHKKHSFKSSEEVAQLNFAKLTLPEYYVYKASTPQSTRALTLPDVLSFSTRSVVTSKGVVRTQMKSIATPSASVNRIKSERSHNITPIKIIPKVKIISQSTDQTRMPILDKKEIREKKIAFWENLAILRASLGKYQASEEDLSMTSKSDLSKIFRFLKHFEELDSSMKGVMDLIVKALENAISANTKALETYFSHELRASNEQINKLYNTYQSKNVSYSTLCSEMARIIAQKNSENNSKDQHYASIINDLEAKIKAQNKSIDDFQVILAQTVPYQLYEETRLQVEAVKEQLVYMTEQNENLQTKNQELGDENQYIKQLFEQEQKEVELLQNQIKDLQKEKGLVQSEADTTKINIQKMQNRIKGLKDIMDKVIVRLTIIKQEIVQLRMQNQTLEDENSKLHVRAAGGFEALTPRPDYRRLQEEKSLDLNIFDPKGKRQILTTVDIVNELLNKMNNLQQKLIAMPPKKRELAKLTISRKESTNSEYSGENTPRLNKSSMFKRDANLSTLKLSIFTGSNINKDGILGTPRSDSSKRAGSRLSNLKRDSFSLSTPELPNNKKLDDSILNTSDEASTASALLNTNNNTKYQKSAFSNQRNVEINKKLRENDYGVTTLKETKALVSDVVNAKNHLKDIESSLE